MAVLIQKFNMRNRKLNKESPFIYKNKRIGIFGIDVFLRFII